MKHNNTSKYAYAAGLIDGDGAVCICKLKVRETGNPTYSIAVDVSQVDGRVIDWLVGTFGGNVCGRPYTTHFHNGKTYVNHVQYHWYLKCKNAAGFLKKILPFLQVKKRQAELCIRLQSRIEVNKERKRKIGFRAGFNQHSDHEIQVREELYIELKRCNHDFRKSLALETKRNDKAKSLEAIVRYPENNNLEREK